MISKSFCFSVNATKIFIAEYDEIENESLIKIWNRKSLNCERVKNDLNKILCTLHWDLTLLDRTNVNFYADFHGGRQTSRNQHGLRR